MNGPKGRKINKKSPRDVVSWSRFFWCTLFVVFNCIFFSGFTFSTFRLLFGVKSRPALVLRWPSPLTKAISGDSAIPFSVREVVMFPDQALVFLNYPRTARLFTKEDLDCVYFPVNGSSHPRFKKGPVDVDSGDPRNQIVRCPLLPARGLTVSVSLKLDDDVAAVPLYSWDSLAYEALIDRDNTTIVFVKGLGLRPGRIADPSRFECVYGWDFSSTKFVLRSDVVSIAQEIVRCKTPLSLLRGSQRGAHHSVKVSVRMKGSSGLIFDTVARPGIRLGLGDPAQRKEHGMCMCSMVRNQGRFLKEWIMYHTRIGVQRWFIYDNNSNDDTEVVIEWLQNANYNVSRHVWPWIKTQEAGFAHCALRARETCQWVGFIDVDEFFHLPSGLLLHTVLKNQSKHSYVGEMRISCYSFGPSGLHQVPPQGVMAGYTCRVAAPERHKSIVRAEALNSTLVNVVHHFHLRDGFEFVNVDRGVMVINHYKYQVWEVFKEKFYRRVATYVADWQDEQNVGSKDRAPGLGTRAVEPPDWSHRFCEVNDSGLRDRVFNNFADPYTNLLPWQHQNQQRQVRRSRKHRPFL